MRKATQLHAGKVPFPGYELRQVIGRGGFGEVWEAQANDGSLVALKFIPCDDNDTAAREIRAIRFVGQLSHPYLIQVRQVWSFRGYIVLAMELAEGSLLDLHEAFLKEYGTPMPWEQVLTFLTQAAEALDFLNTRQHVLNGQRVAVQHCDIKPSNILLFGDSIKLCDYGLASQTSSTVKSHRRAGSLHFAAPEIFQGRLSDRSDQYALAVTYCQLRSGREPFPDTPEHFDRAYIRPRPDLSMLTEAERPIIARGLAAIPMQRWPSCQEMMARLAQVAT